MVLAFDKQEADKHGAKFIFNQLLGITTSAGWIKDAQASPLPRAIPKGNSRPSFCKVLKTCMCAEMSSFPDRLSAKFYMSVGAGIPLLVFLIPTLIPSALDTCPACRWHNLPWLSGFQTGSSDAKSRFAS